MVQFTYNQNAMISKRILHNYNSLMFDCLGQVPRLWNDLYFDPGLDEHQSALRTRAFNLVKSLCQPHVVGYDLHNAFQVRDSLN